MANSDSDIIFETRDLHVRFGQAKVLRGISLVIRRGEVVAVLGANGSGKSTLIKTLVGIQEAHRGTVIRPNAASIGYVPQRASAAGGIPATAAEVVASGMLTGRRLWLPRQWRARAVAALEQVGLADRAGEATIHLSGGQQQRVLIARALVRNPQVLVLDEPVAGVDADSQRQFALALSKLVAQGITIVVVLHEIGDFAPLITRTIILKQGKVIADGPPQLDAFGHDALDHDHQHDHDGVAHELTTRLAEHESGFNQFSPQLQGLTKHHRGHRTGR
ncbi:MAG: metal ABC transporter ATP-binding protein [Cellulomonadaceae bacterium]|jgi:zinc transport system ATP-binding protein|nr:metal ABC transporter ATP-binding protein [Cellulomonadaceae bacterium]